MKIKDIIVTEDPRDAYNNVVKIDIYYGEDSPGYYGRHYYPDTKLPKGPINRIKKHL